MLAGQPGERKRPPGWEAAGLAGGVVRLVSTAEDERQARDALLGLLVGQTGGRGARIWSRSAPSWRSAGLGGWRTCWRSTRTLSLTCCARPGAGDPGGAACRDGACGRSCGRRRAGCDISAASGGVAAGVIHGERDATGPYPAGPGEHLAGPGIGVVESGAVVAVWGGGGGRPAAVSPAAGTAGQPVRAGLRPPS